MQKIGDFAVTRIIEFVAKPPLLDALIPEATPERVRNIPWLHPNFADFNSRLGYQFQTYVISTPAGRIVIDTGIGNHKSRPSHPAFSNLDTDFLHQMNTANVPPTSVDYVLLTHFHFDHVGWNTYQEATGEWVPTFPNARYLYGQREYDEYSALLGRSDCAGDDAELAQRTQLMSDSLEPPITWGLVDFVDSHHSVAPGINYEPADGHTPGHLMVSVESAGQRAYFIGDLMHSPAQVAHPEWASTGDHDPDLATRRRQSFLESVADTNTLVFGAHWPGAGGGRVIRAGHTFQLIAT